MSANALPRTHAARAFGEHLTVKDVMAKQMRIERQDKANIESVSFDRFAADSFQLYVQGKEGTINRAALT